ncbi:hypothetical protein BX281_3332 [Streptomyces sp. Ag82_O1-15]|nr:hypothetical protein BX281_3332 [Streptomyces sp. Ag82_O1-15]
MLWARRRLGGVDDRSTWPAGDRVRESSVGRKGVVAGAHGGRLGSDGTSRAYARAGRCWDAVVGRREVLGCGGGPGDGWSPWWLSWRGATRRKVADRWEDRRRTTTRRGRRPVRRRTRRQRRLRAGPGEARRCRPPVPPLRRGGVPLGIRRSPSVLVTRSNSGSVYGPGLWCRSSCGLARMTSGGRPCGVPRRFSSWRPDGGWTRTVRPTPRCGVREPGPVRPRSPRRRRHRMWRVRRGSPLRCT